MNALLILTTVGFLTATATAGTIPFFFSTGNPDGKIGTLSRPAATGQLETETADDFVTTLPTTINGATFTGLLPSAAALSSVSDVQIELYHIFPVDSTNPPSGNVPTRVNSPSDFGFAAFDQVAGDIAVTTSVLSASFTVGNTVVNGIHASPNQFTGGEGPGTGEEVLFTVTFTTPVMLPVGHYFFRPEVKLASGNFLWLSAPKPIVAPGTPFGADLQSWIRNSNLSPDWLRIGTDITHQGPFNATFSLTGTQDTGPASTPVPPSAILTLVGLAGLGLYGASRKFARGY
ncbi:MAG TPA: PEP-CTERM sorting domain-containing protein [Bryobacteraceae bacterium]|nr:PEP-CTERM sorting domain-containing protein [Bryobacteraceae bacterium]